jgi:hypothetical protein
MRHVSLIAVTGSLLFALICGCGSGSSIKESYLFTSNISTTPAQLTSAGGTVKVQVTIVNPPSSNDDMSPSRSPGYDVTDPSGNSIFTTPTHFNAVPDYPYSGAFTFSLPSNAGGASPKTYSITVLNYQGTANGYLLPVGTVTVPN